MVDISITSALHNELTSVLSQSIIVKNCRAGTVLRKVKETAFHTLLCANGIGGIVHPRNLTAAQELWRPTTG